jgi:glycosyltransferase involved in cell wall biosynthesis
MKKIAIVIPAYNEVGNVEVMIQALHKVFETIPYSYEILFVDDGSKDETLQKIKDISVTDYKVFYIELSRNFGHQNALKAGVDTVIANAVITMDGDMQHPPELIPELIKKWEEGYDVVYTRREEDKNLSFLKKKTSSGFYKLMNKISEVEFEAGTADFRLLDEKVVKVFSNFNENELFIRGLISWLGFKQFAIDYKPSERYSGNSKYTIVKMMRFALQGITSFSIRPLYFAIILGFVLSFLAFGFYIVYLIYSIYLGHVISGWASVICTIVFFGGLNLIVLGIVGLYVGKLFMQSKQRPNYLIRTTNYL